MSNAVITREMMLKRFSEQCRRNREAYGWSQQYVADQVDSSRITINRIERQNQEPEATLMLRLADLLEIPLDSLKRSKRRKKISQPA